MKKFVLVFFLVLVNAKLLVLKMPCSAVTLSLATITSIIAVALLTIAFATDNWVYVEVKRSVIQVKNVVFDFSSGAARIMLIEESLENPIFF